MLRFDHGSPRLDDESSESDDDKTVSDEVGLRSNRTTDNHHSEEDELERWDRFELEFDDESRDRVPEELTRSRAGRIRGTKRDSVFEYY